MFLVIYLLSICHLTVSQLPEYVPPKALFPWITVHEPQVGTRQESCQQCTARGLPAEDPYNPPLGNSYNPSLPYGHPSDPRLRFGFPIFATTAAPALPCCTTTDTTTTDCVCGKTKTRIVGGTETTVNEYPWIALLDLDGAQCGGSLIADKWILTAAHCFFDSSGNQVVTDPSKIKITLGEHDTTSTTETTITKVVTPDLIKLHSDYASSSNVNDIALLRLPTAESLTTYAPVCLPATGSTYVGKKAWVYGWGTTSSGGQVSEKLLDVEVPVVSDADAKTALASQSPLTDAQLAVMIFAGGESGKDSCQGDSGGPLSYINSGKHEQIGVVSWGIGCATAGLPGAYADVPVFRSWIDTQISSNGGATFCSA